MNPNNLFSDSSDDSMTQKEFQEWLQDPVNQKAFMEEMKNVAGGEYGALTPEVMQSANTALSAHHAKERISVVSKKLRELVALLGAPAGTMSGRLEQCDRLVDETTDLMLDLPEPHRTTFMKQFLLIREQVKRISEQRDDGR